MAVFEWCANVRSRSVANSRLAIVAANSQPLHVSIVLCKDLCVLLMQAAGSIEWPSEIIVATQTCCHVQSLQLLSSVVQAQPGCRRNVPLTHACRARLTLASTCPDVEREIDLSCPRSSSLMSLEKFQHTMPSAATVPMAAVLFGALGSLAAPCTFVPMDCTGLITPPGFMRDWGIDAAAQQKCCDMCANNSACAVAVLATDQVRVRTCILK